MTSEELFEDLNIMVEQIANERGYNKNTYLPQVRSQYSYATDIISVAKTTKYWEVYWSNRNCTIAIDIELIGNDAFIHYCDIRDFGNEKEIEAIADFNELYLRIARLIQRR